METEPVTSFTIEKISAETLDEANQVRLQSWLDTYVNDELGITREWIEARNKDQMSEDARQRRLARLDNPKAAGWVARDEHGTVIGITTPYVDQDGKQHVGSLYVEKSWHGKGIAGQLMQRVIDWCDPENPIELGVVTNNERAKAFYRKWGFKEIPGSEKLFANNIPEVMMIRKGEKQ